MTSFAQSQKQLSLQNDSDPASYVDPFIGTAGFGHTFPGAILPFGMVQLSPDTRTSGWENCSGYHSDNKTIIGFSHTHLSGTGAADYGDIMLMPCGIATTDPGPEENPSAGYRSAFEHRSEAASPGYYKVNLEDEQILVELTATTRTGMQRYRYAKPESAYVVLDLKHGIADQAVDCSIKIENNTTITGYRRSSGWAKDQFVYFCIEFSRPFTTASLSNEQSTSKDSVQGVWAKCLLDFSNKKSGELLVRTGISSVSAANARKNLHAENNGWDFEKVKSSARQAWNTELNRINVSTEDKKRMQVFYTALYHCMISPNIYSDVDGRYRGMDGNIYTMEQAPMYTVYSLWDTFRALHPLFTMIDPERAKAFVWSLVQKYRESGMLPVWELASNETGCMIGYHSVPVIADAIAKGLIPATDGDVYAAMKNAAMQDHLGLKYYKSQGYIPADKENEAVSKTLEYAYDDWCIAKVAQLIGKEADATYFYRRSMNWQNCYDAETGFMRGKKNGNWYQPFDPNEVSGIYTEANAWQYAFFAPHAITEMKQQMGGNAAFISKLDALFTAPQNLSGRSQPDISGMIGQYAHGNEPSHHMAYLYMYTSQPFKTAPLCRKIMDELYTTDRDGLTGNEDCGQMSAWYVLSAMGLYPVCPGKDYYAYGSPLFKKVVLHPEKGKSFTISTENANDSLIWPVASMINGQLQNTFITNKQILEGGTLTFTMGAAKNVPAFHIPDTDVIPVVAPVPYIQSGPKAFHDSCTVTIHSPLKAAKVYYRYTQPNADTTWQLYKAPLVVRQTLGLATKTILPGALDGFEDQVNFIRVPSGRKVIYNTMYSETYTAGGENGLIDSEYGAPEAFGNWQGFYGHDMQVIVDLGKEEALQVISTGFLQQAPSWIWLPSEVVYELGTDTLHFKAVRTITNTVPVTNQAPLVHSFSAGHLNQKARYIRITAKNIGVCPEWHPGAGYPAWIFVDEITIK